MQKTIELAEVDEYEICELTDEELDLIGGGGKKTPGYGP